MKCACTVTLSPWTAPPCCRVGAEPVCPFDRCQHIELGPIPATTEPVSTALFEQYRQTVQMLRDAQDAHRRAAEECRRASEVLQEAGDLCITLACEEARLLDALRAAVAGEVGLHVGETEGSGETLTEALARGPRYVGDNSVNHGG